MVNTSIKNMNTSSRKCYPECLIKTIKIVLLVFDFVILLVIKQKQTKVLISPQCQKQSQ